MDANTLLFLEEFRSVVTIHGSEQLPGLVMRAMLTETLHFTLQRNRINDHTELGCRMVSRSERLSMGKVTGTEFALRSDCQWGR